MKLLCLIFLLPIAQLSTSQMHPEDVVHKFFHAMNDIDTSYLNELIDDDASLASIYVSYSTSKLEKTSKEQFLNSIASSDPSDLDEQISNLKTDIDGGLANIWMDYTFYYQGKLSHCGVNNFTMALTGDQWKVISITDSRRKSDCKLDKAKSDINQMIDKWHLGATNADSTAYFDLMSSNSVYVGTDKSEVWSKRQFLKFAAPYFAKGKAWAFTKVERNIYSEDFEKIAWFDEVLDTWMGPCRGSGVVIKNEAGEWKVKHYVLSVAISNDDVNDYINLIEKKSKN